MIPDEVARTIIHGSPQGYELGCRSRGGCANHGHRTLLTCVDAHAAARADWSIGRRPRNEAIPKSALRFPRATPKPPRTVDEEAPTRTAIKHGTVHGFNRGCRTIEDCPRHAIGEPTCTERHRRYYREYYAARRQRTDDVPHGTATGYSYGCHDRRACPGGSDGVTCSDAARAAERLRRNAGEKAAA